MLRRSFWQVHGSADQRQTRDASTIHSVASSPTCRQIIPASSSPCGGRRSRSSLTCESRSFIPATSDAATSVYFQWSESIPLPLPLRPIRIVRPDVVNRMGPEDPSPAPRRPAFFPWPGGVRADHFPVAGLGTAEEGLEESLRQEFAPLPPGQADEEPAALQDKSTSKAEGLRWWNSSSGARNSSGNVTSHEPRARPAPGGAEVGGEEGEGGETEQQGHELVSLLTSCADSISSGNYEAINYFLGRLGDMATPMGTPVHRLVAYFTESLALRVARLYPHIFTINAPPRRLLDASEEDDATALRLLDLISPIPKFVHFTLNEMLLKAFQGRDRVHVIDLDIKQGLQWPSLLQSLASRPSPPSHVRITGVGESRPDLHATGVRLARIAESLHLPFEFHPVVDRFEDLRLWMLHVKREECVAVSCSLVMHRALHDETGKAFMDLLGLIRSTNPATVVMAEQEAEHNEPEWGRRLARSLNHYAAIFDSLDDVLPQDSHARIKVEELFAKEIRNIVACEGDERIERHESFEGWRRKMMQEGGFTWLGIGEREMLQSRMILRMYSCNKYSIDVQGREGEGGGGGEEGHGLTLKWLDQPLYTVSAWVPVGVAGSSSPHLGQI
ncbi:hypothetical protein BHM03_00013102 [Ensete ventricosum]|nr:hypothetical protein BHM03_00013102 [Ensete ventricosum]